MQRWFSKLTAANICKPRVIVPPSKIQVSDLVVQLALGLALRLRLARQGKVGEVILGALRVRSEQLRFLGV